MAEVAARAVLAGALLFSVLLTNALWGRASDALPDAAPAREVRSRNLELIRRFLAETTSPTSPLGDYYFALIGDVQNSVRSLDHDVFEAIAADMLEAKDGGSGAPLFDRIRFVILLGDMVHEGPSAIQWDALGKALAGKTPEGTPYPHLEKLAREKPIFPVLGNHELLSFRPRLQTRYMDLFDSAKGARSFKEFFGWDRLIADPHILYPVPADLPEDLFRRLIEGIPDAADRRSLGARYVQKKDSRYHLRFFENPPLDEASFKDAKDSLAAELAPIFRKAGYGTLPVLNSDNMIDYAFEAGGVVFVFLDSMARGWQYPNFRRLKERLHPSAGDVHRLNLFSLSPFNGQADFFHAVARTAREHGQALIPMMHQSPFNSSRNIYSTGLEYNVWLALGLPQAAQDAGDPTLLDDVIFSDVPYAFSACVHAYESLSLASRSPGRAEHALRWFVTGGGGGPLRGDFSFERNALVATLYNRKLAREAGPDPARSVEIRDDVPRIGHHYLIVHVKDGSLVDVSPRFVDPGERVASRIPPTLTVRSSFLTSPASTGASVEFSPWERQVRRLHGYLAFMSWTPSVSLGMVSYNTWKNGLEPRTYAAVLEVTPLAYKCYLPGTRTLTFRLPGLEAWLGGSRRYRLFMTMGVELPLVYDIFGKLRDLTVGITARVPFHHGTDDNLDFGGRTSLALSAGYRFRL